MSWIYNLIKSEKYQKKKWFLCHFIEEWLLKLSQITKGFIGVVYFISSLNLNISMKTKKYQKQRFCSVKNEKS